MANDVKVFYFRGENGVTNFGDELNRCLWPRLLPGAFDREDGRIFVGIGTLLNDRLPAARRTIVFGAGVGYYGPPRRDDTWAVYCVRGPLSAAALGLSPETAVTDPAALLARLDQNRNPSAPRWRHAFMPHWQSQPDDWKEVCDAIGIGFIDARWPPADVLDALRRTDVLMTEALHGAVVADALRIPWIPVRTHDGIKSFKWEDWCRSVGLEYGPCRLPTIWPNVPQSGSIRCARRWAKRALAAHALARLAMRGRPFLSRDDVLQERLDMLEERLDRVRERELADATVPTAAGVPRVTGIPDDARPMRASRPVARSQVRSSA